MTIVLVDRLKDTSLTMISDVTHHRGPDSLYHLNRL